MALNTTFPTTYTRVTAELMAADIKRALARQIKTAMDMEKISQTELARRMDTSRALVRRILSDEDLSITLVTISKTAAALDKTLNIQLGSS